jgi:predicted amidohydrolase
MRICAAQTRPIKGDIQRNLANHTKLIDQAVDHAVELIIFPELSLTGYEPTLARELATDPNDTRLDALQKISDSKAITIGVGAPTKNEKGICIGLLLFQPHKPRHVYSKTFIHADEEPFFVRGQSSPHFRFEQTKIALAICYEISVPEHLESVLKSKPAFYCASVVKSVNGINKALDRLSNIARECSFPVLMSNCVGVCDGMQCAGRSSAWNNRGSLVGQLNDSDEGLLIFDTEKQEVIRS